MLHIFCALNSIAHYLGAFQRGISWISARRRFTLNDTKLDKSHCLRVLERRCRDDLQRPVKRCKCKEIHNMRPDMQRKLRPEYNLSAAELEITHILILANHGWLLDKIFY
jgi:hypothetical protein